MLFLSAGATTVVAQDATNCNSNSSISVSYTHLDVYKRQAVVGANEQFPHQSPIYPDAGTCITYEFIDSKGQYHGGNISPGMQMLSLIHIFL